MAQLVALRSLVTFRASSISFHARTISTEHGA